MSARELLQVRRPWVAGILVTVLGLTLVGMPAPARPASDGPGPSSPGQRDWAAVKAGAGTPATVRAISRVARSVAPAAARAGGAALTESATAALTPCEDDAAFLCTTVPVPLDRRHPDARKVNLHVEVFPHTGPEAGADGAVFVTCGGPGCSATLDPKYGFSFFVLPEIAETRDLVYVDQRGVGLSDVIDCPELQAGELGHLYDASRACHDQLGDAADLYSTTDVADDLEDVRKALGYDEIDLFGGSYAGDDMITYTVRHQEHVRSVVLSAPAMVVGVDPFYAAAPKAMPRIVAAVCRRSPACARADSHPARTFAGLARRLRHDPVVGTGVDSAGDRHRMKVTENLLSNFITYFNGAHFTGPGEITPATKAMRRGDRVPLLRLAADVDPRNGFGADLREFSNGHNLARVCVDGEFAFDKEAGARKRWHQYAAAYAAEPDFYGAISKKAWAAPDWLGWQPPPCIASRWEDRPMYPAGTTVTGVPTLVLGGEYDLPVPLPIARLATGVMQGATFVRMSAAGHDPQFWSDCGPELVQRFYRDLDVGDTSCADRPAGGWWVPGTFPTRVHQAPAARQTHGPRANRHQRRLVTVAAWTVMDSVQHNFFVPGDSVALRGGIVDFEPLENGAQWTLRKARFSRDVIVNGVVADHGDGVFHGTFRVRGPGRHRVTRVHFNGPFLSYGDSITLRADFGRGVAAFKVPAY
jgi:pimeloyl-ACP methyl ester carboxylesterase